MSQPRHVHVSHSLTKYSQQISKESRHKKKKKIAYNSVTKHLLSDLSIVQLLYMIQLETGHVPNFGLPWISAITLKASLASKVIFYWHNMDNIQYCLTSS